MSLTENLKELMVRHGNITISGLASATGIPQPTLHQLYTGHTQKPREKTLVALASYFSVSLEQLMGFKPLIEGLSPSLIKQLGIPTAPLISWDDLDANISNIAFKKHTTVFLESDVSNAIFAVKMTGLSMLPRFPEGCLLIFDAGRVARDGDYVMVHLKKSQEFVFKKLLIDSGCSYVQSINPDLSRISPMKLSADDKIMATLIEARIKFSSHS